MVSQEPVLLIVAADWRELAGVAHKMSGVHAVVKTGASEGTQKGLAWCRRGSLRRRSIVLAANGAGPSNAARAVDRISDLMRVAAVVSTGLCGALDPALLPGDLVAAERVLSLDPPLEFAARPPGGCSAPPARKGTVLTVDHVVQSAGEKRRLRATGASVVEMEAAGVAAEACKRGLPFFCVRAVSDGAEESFGIDYNRARRPDGSFSPADIVAQAGLRPARWAELIQWRRRMRLAAERLGDFFASSEFD